MKVKKVAVLAVPLGKEPEVRLIQPDLESLMEFVGGTLSGEWIAPNLTLYANDGGLQLRLPYNRCGYVGNFLIAKISSAGNEITMTDRDVAKARGWLTRNDHRPPLCHVCGRPGGTTLFCRCRDVLILCASCYDQLCKVLNAPDLETKRRFCLCSRCRAQKQEGET